MSVRCGEMNRSSIHAIQILAWKAIQRTDSDILTVRSFLVHEEEHHRLMMVLTTFQVLPVLALS